MLRYFQCRNLLKESSSSFSKCSQFLPKAFCLTTAWKSDYSLKWRRISKTTSPCHWLSAVTYHLPQWAMRWETIHFIVSGKAGRFHRKASVRRNRSFNINNFQRFLLKIVLWVSFAYCIGVSYRFRVILLEFIYVSTKHALINPRAHHIALCALSEKFNHVSKPTGHGDRNTKKLKAEVETYCNCDERLE